MRRSAGSPRPEGNIVANADWIAFSISHADTGDDHSTSAHEWLQGLAIDAGNVTWPVGQYWGTPNFGDGALPFSSEGGILILRLAP